VFFVGSVMRKMKVSIIGTGRVGTALGTALKNKGYSIAGVSSRKRGHALKLISLTGCKYWSPNPESVSVLADIVFLTVPDDTVESLCQKIAKKNGFKGGSLIVHTSGALPSSILSSAKDTSHLSMHPVKSFTERIPDSLEGIFFALEGDKEGVKRGKKIVRDLRGIPFTIREENKILYHSALSFASPYLCALLYLSSSILKKAGVEKADEIAISLAKGTVRNIESLGILKSFTGPVLRNDREIIKREIAELKNRFPEAGEVYKLLEKIVSSTAKPRKM